MRNGIKYRCSRLLGLPMCIICCVSMSSVLLILDVYATAFHFDSNSNNDMVSTVVVRCSAKLIYKKLEYRPLSIPNREDTRYYRYTDDTQR